jgi:hypothetical protein
MAPPIPTQEPSSVNAGDTVRWQKTLPNHPATDGWALRYTFINGAAKFTLQSAPGGAQAAHTLEASASTTALWSPGEYDWICRAELGAEAYTVATGRTTVAPDAANQLVLDKRSQARRTLDAIEATIEGRASSATAEYEINGRRMRYIPISELFTLRDRYRAEVAREDAARAIAAGGLDSRRIYVRFGP